MFAATALTYNQCGDMVPVIILQSELVVATELLKSSRHPSLSPQWTIDVGLDGSESLFFF